MNTATKARRMSKRKQNREPRQFGLPADAIVERIEPPRNIGRFVAPPCSRCCAIDLPNRRSTHINGTETRVNTATEMIISRAIKCSGCGSSWMDYEVIKHKTA